MLAGAIARLRETHRTVHLALVGEPDPGRARRTNILQRLRSLNLLDATTVLGFQTDVLSLEAAADAVVLCSEGEPLGTVILESMALARPVIVAASGGLPEMIENGGERPPLAPGDPAPLACEIERLILNPAFARELGASARARARMEFSLTNHVATCCRFTKNFSQIRRDASEPRCPEGPTFYLASAQKSGPPDGRRPPGDGNRPRHAAQ